jgi:molybdate transport system substrate-binding protein
MADRLKLFCAGAARSSLGDLLDRFEAETGVAVDVKLGPVGKLVEALATGERADAVILSDVALAQLSRQGVIRAETIFPIGSVGFALARKKQDGSAASPAISSADDVRSLLLKCASFAYADPANGDSSGLHMASVIEKLGIQQEMRAKQVLEPLGLAVAEAVASGRAELGALQESIVLARKDLELAGSLPEALQKVTTYAFGMAESASPEGERLGDFLSAPAARARYVSAGFA